MVYFETSLQSAMPFCLMTDCVQPLGVVHTAQQNLYKSTTSFVVLFASFPMFLDCFSRGTVENTGRETQLNCLI